MKKLIKDILTGVDGQTYDAARVAMWPGLLGMIGLAGYNIYKGLNVDYMAFGTGFAAILAAAGAAIGMKKDTEPKQ